MNQNYIDSCIKEALQQAKGNRQEATRILMARAIEDQLLEDGLFANFREAATHYHVQRVAHQMEQNLRGGPQIATQAFDSLVSTLQQNLGKNPLDAANLKDAPRAAVNKTESGEEHVSSLRAIAGAFSKKKPTTT